MYEIETENSKLYDKSVEVNCLIGKCLKRESSSHIHTELDQYHCTRNRFRDRDFDKEYTLIQGQSDVCAVKPDTWANSCDYPDVIGFAANTGMMYPLDEFNTYRNYPVCRNKYDQCQGRNRRICELMNVQIFDNLTRKNNEVVRRDRDTNVDLIVETTIKPKGYHDDDHKCVPVYP